MGFDWVFVNPIQRTGASRSLYSIADYFEINPVLLDAGNPMPSEQQVREMTADTHAVGLKQSDQTEQRSWRSDTTAMAYVCLCGV